MRQRYDASSKWLIETFADSILKLAGITGVESWVAVGSELVQSRQLPDGLVEVKFAGRNEPVLFLFEVNTYPETRLAEELLEDLMMAYLNRGTVPEMVTLVLRPKGQVTIPSDLTRISPLGNTTFSMHWRVIDLWEQTTKAVSSTVDPGMVPWMTLMKTQEPPEAFLSRCREIVETVENPNHRENLLAITQVMASIRYDADILTRVFLREPAMIESPFLEEWTKHRLIRERHKMILDVLMDRFEKPSDEIAAAVRSVKDDSRLRVLAKAAATCQSIEQFQITLHATL